MTDTFHALVSVHDAQDDYSVVYEMHLLALLTVALDLGCV